MSSIVARADTEGTCCRGFTSRGSAFPEKTEKYTRGPASSDPADRYRRRFVECPIRPYGLSQRVEFYFFLE